jgi:phosphatidylethanolamine/phosphatidyl-N-methylethanolamine N-methyltransferase
MDLLSVRNAYRRYARYYDHIFGAVFNPGRRLSVEIANSKPNRRVLEVGVGTGLSLPYYRRDCRVTGIDISPEMLDKARQRQHTGGLHNIEALLEMDAEQLEFADQSFDCVLAMYVVSVVPHPERLLKEMCRVCAPDGDIIIINHFASRHPLLRTMEKGLAPLSKVIGFRPNMELAGLPRLPGFECVGIQGANLFGFWKLVHYRGRGAAQSAPLGRSAPLRTTAGVNAASL